MSFYRDEEQNEGKMKRIPMSGLRLKLQMSKEDRQGFKDRGVVPHWFNDQDGRIEMAQAAGYAHVDPKDARSLGTKDKDKVSKVVTKGNELVMKAYLMVIKKEFFDEDQAANWAINDLVDEALQLNDLGATGVEQAYKPE